MIAPEPNAFAATAVRLSQPYSFNISPNNSAEVVAYRDATSLLLHIIRHEKVGEPVTLLLHKKFAANIHARLHIPGVEAPQSLPLTATPESTSLTVPHAPLYCVVEIPLQ